MAAPYKVPLFTALIKAGVSITAPRAAFTNTAPFFTLLNMSALNKWKLSLLAGTCKEMISASAMASSTESLYSKKSNELFGYAS